MSMRRWPGVLFYVVVVCALGVDQGTKAWATSSLEPVESVVVVPGWFDLTYVRNAGVAFGMFAQHGWVVALFMVALAIVALFYARGVNWGRWQANVIGGFLVGGALGNLIDRWRLGQVVDFLDVHAGRYHWPVFNVADSLICVAVGWMVWGQLGGEGWEKEKGKR